MRLVLALAATCLFAADPNTLSPQERSAGWKLLFDGQTLAGWIDPATRTPPSDSWVIRDGCLMATREPRVLEDLVTQDSFQDFEFAFDWRIEPGGNSGIKFRIYAETFLVYSQPGYKGGRRAARGDAAPNEASHTYLSALEFQLIDNERHPDAKKGASRTTGALYAIIAPTAGKLLPAGEWNTARLVVRGSRVEHWVNGVRMMVANVDDASVLGPVRERVSKDPARLRSFEERWGKPSPIALQNHGDSVVWFRNLKIHPL